MEMCPKRARLGDALAALGRKVGLTDEDIAAIDRTRDKTPAKPIILTGAPFKAPAHRST
jgi:plasmid stability protein